MVSTRTVGAGASANGIEVVAFDGDDTLWHSEVHFADVEARLRELAAPWLSADDFNARLVTTETTNLTRYGYGVKSFALSALEVLLDCSQETVSGEVVAEVVTLAKGLLDQPTVLLDGVIDTLDALAGHYRLALVTKGDLFHQWMKIEESGLVPHFERIEVVPEKDPATYRRIVGELGITGGELCMVGNSVRSDVLPVLEIGAHAVHIPYEITWAFEHSDDDGDWARLTSIRDLPDALTRLH